MSNTFAINPPGAGQLQLNSIVPPTSDGTWSGDYFVGHPLRLEARPHPGYRLAGWGGLPGVSMDKVNFELTGDWTVTAQFEVDPAARPLLVMVHAGVGRIRLNASGPANSLGFLETSTDLAHWEPGRELAFDMDGQVTLFIETARVERAVFYRVRLAAPDVPPHGA
jgi:hypothetical protein